MESDPASQTDDGGAGLTRDDVAKVAELALLELTDADLDRFTDQLGAVLQRAEELAAFDIADVPRTLHPQPLHNVYRPDVVIELTEDQREEVLANAPAEESGRFKVPPALGEEP
ncbi:MAG: Asp-tRNA(Asn)/Glu-tRNA(Gln) amidotransferase subunit GatC [Actinomycetota bacterium]